MKLSVITVCFNAEKTIRYTIESILKQTYNDFEYLIVDGKSTDRTYDIVCEYDEYFNIRNIPYRHISEEDCGIFDAMNKASKIAMGEWVCFINADDQLYDNNVLEKVFYEDLNQYDVVYGNVFRVGSGTNYVDKSSSIKYIMLTMPFCHQASFTRKELIKFDLKYIVADYNLFLELYLDGKKFKQIDLTIAKYSMEGYSNQDRYKTYLDVVKVKAEHGLVNMNSILQRLKNMYHRILLNDRAFGHDFFYGINKAITERRKRQSGAEYK